MKLALVFAAVLAVSAVQTHADIFRSRLPTFKSFPSNRFTSSDQAANVLRYDNEANPDGSYRYDVQIDNGIAAQARGTPRDFGGNPPVAPVVSQGSFSWTSPEGQRFHVTYVADENGYRPSVDATVTLPSLSYFSQSMGSQYGSGFPTLNDVAGSITSPLQNRTA